MTGDFASFDDAAQTTFKGKLVAGLEGIDDDQVNIVNVKAGSIVVTYDITPKAGQTLDDVKNAQTTAF